MRHRLPREDDQDLTPIGDLFTYHIFGVPRASEQYRKDPGSFTLRITGSVHEELSLTLAQIRGEFPAVAVPMVLQCTTNVHWGRVMVAGARLTEVLARAGVKDGARKVVYRADDGFESDLRLEAVQADPDAVLIAYEMNGEALTCEHGYPLRMTANGRYGYKWPKWVSEIAVVESDYRGHYEGKRGWSDEGIRGRPVT